MRVTMDEYLRLKAFSAGLAHRILIDSPFHAWHSSPYNPDYRARSVNVANIGTCAHAILLEGNENSISCIQPADYPSKQGGIPLGWTNNAIRAARDEAIASGKTPILATDMADIRLMVETARQYLAASELAGIFDAGDPELTFTWTEKGVPCKIRPDWLNLKAKVCLSYKTTPASAAPDSWIRRQLPGYAVGMPLYERGVRAATGVERARVVHLVQEQNRPYACSLIALDPAAQSVAEAKLDQALATWKQCLETKKFPAYPLNICYAEARSWEVAEVEAAEAETLEFDQ